MVRIKRAGRVAANIARSLHCGVKPLDTEAHHRITVASLGVLRRCDEKSAYGYYKENLCHLQSGIAGAESGDAAAAHICGYEFCAYTAEKHMRAARMCVVGNKEDLALAHLGVVLHVLQDACVPSVSTARMIASGDIIEACIKKRYSPLSRCKAVRSMPIVLEKPSEFIKEAIRAQQYANLRSFGVNHKYDPSLLYIALDTAEQLCAGLLLKFYEEVLAEKYMEKDGDNEMRNDRADTDINAKVTEDSQPDEKDPIASAPLDVGGGEPIDDRPYGPNSDDNDF